MGRRVLVGMVVADDEQRAARGDGLGQPGDELAEGHGGVHVLADHQVVPLRRCPRRQVGHDPRDVVSRREVLGVADGRR
jgi:hypothetical protein